MAIRNVVTEGDEILRKKCKPIDKISERNLELLDDMVETMRLKNGVGLAAPQVGVMRRMFVAEPEKGKLYYMINPEIVKTEGEQESEEGCLSVPGYLGTVKRPEKITIKALDRDGKKQTYELEGFEAIVMCHENDHLDGILYTDKATNVHTPEEENQEEENQEKTESKNQKK